MQCQHKRQVSVYSLSISLYYWLLFFHYYNFHIFIAFGTVLLTKLKLNWLLAWVLQWLFKSNSSYLPNQWDFSQSRLAISSEPRQISVMMFFAKIVWILNRDHKFQWIRIFCNPIHAVNLGVIELNKFSFLSLLGVCIFVIYTANIIHRNWEILA